MLMWEKLKFSPAAGAIAMTLGCLILIAGGLLGYPYWVQSAQGVVHYGALWLFLLLLILGIGLAVMGVRLIRFGLNKEPKSKITICLRTKALKSSLALGLGYVAVAWLYLIFSSEVGGGFIQSIQSIGDYTLAKDLVFTTVSGAIIFVWSYYLLRLAEDKSGEILHYQGALEQAGQQATAGVIAASIAHDSVNVLASMRFCLELIERKAPAMPELESSQELLATMKKAVAELGALNRRVLDASNPQDSVYLQERDLVSEVRTTLSLARANNRVKHCRLVFEGDASLSCKIHSAWVSEMLLNLVLNAGDATSNAGEILVKVYRSGDFALIEVHDNGRGIQPEDRERIFVPFFTTKREGHGLGLMAVKSCVERHNGFLQVGTSHLGGALFSIWLPAKISKAPPSASEPQLRRNGDSISTENSESLAAVGS